ncbi:GAF domain-containing protein [Paludibacterium yongneupense]|uniref:GAF domain-containing protein n=1 Tax=Paludibacterium yongneupense TaxID=400061 RepID=UPI00040EB4EB|nr:GAF domain-containing protein [Paludibacterium yongneupense]
MIATSELAAYLKEQALDLETIEVQIAAMTLGAVLDADKPPAHSDLYRFPVPLLGEDGACSLVDELAAEPYDLAPLFGGVSAEATTALRNLAALLESTNLRVGADWLGVYRRVGEGRGARLVKMAYLGLPSRAEFPLTEAFAEISNNSRVGLTGWGGVIEDVAQWQATGGGYYQCDPAVRSEVCLPVLDGDGRVIGILDAESAEPGFFSPDRLAWLAALAAVLVQPLLALPVADASEPSLD